MYFNAMQFMLTGCRLSNNWNEYIVHWTEVHWFRIILPIAHTHTHIKIKKPQLETNRKIHTRNLKLIFCMWCDQSTHWTATDMKHPQTHYHTQSEYSLCEQTFESGNLVRENKREWNEVTRSVEKRCPIQSADFNQNV